MAETKITKKDFFAAIRTMVEGIEAVGDIPADKVLEFIDTQVAQIDAKAAKAKARAGEKKAEGDEISKRILEVLTDDFQTGEYITQLVSDIPEITKSKVVARLSNLVKQGKAEKEQIKTEDGRKVMSYKLSDAKSDVAEDAE